MAAANTAIKAVADDLDAAVDDLNSISSKSNSCAFESCPESDTDEPKQCPEITGISGGGTVHGSDRHIGATRGFSCDDGSVLVGAKHVYCQSDQTWSPEIPKCEATGTNRNDITFQRQCSFSFPSSAKTLAITGFDAEKGCAMGGLVLSCGSSDKSSPWSSFSSQSGTLVGSSNLWKAFGNAADEEYVSRICADESNAFNFEGGKKTYWWFRVTI
eukprot:gene5243-20118_t